MPTLPHPLTLEDHALARNRLRVRRTLWEQTVFGIAVYALLVMVALAWWLRMDAVWIAQAAESIRRYESVLALIALAAGSVFARLALHRDARRHYASAYAVLPIQHEMQRRRDRRLRALLIVRMLVATLLGLALLALRDPPAALIAADSLRWSLIVAFLGIVLMPAPRWAKTLRSEQPTRARAASAPPWLVWLSVPTLPYLPNWWWQRAGQTWMRGRAATILAVGLLLAPSEVAAFLLPVTLLLIGALVNGLDVAHRLAGDTEHLLAARPPKATVLWRALWPLHVVLTTLLVGFSGIVLMALQLPVLPVLLVLITLLIAASVDLLLAVVLRRTPVRLTMARTQLVLITVAITSALPLLMPLVVCALLWTLIHRLRKDAAHA